MIETILKGAPLKDGPKSMKPEGGGGGKIETVLQGAPISTNPVSMTPKPFGPKVDTILKGAPISMTPNKPEKASDRAVKQSK
jgi:hypothetical protein